MQHTDRTCTSVETTRRSFMSATAGLGAVAIALLGKEDAVSAGDGVKSQSGLDLASVVTHQLAFPGSQAEFKSAFDSIIVHENAHVAFLKKALGSAARPKPTFQGLKQSNVQNFVTLATAFENTGAGAYLNAAYYIKSKTYLSAAASIALVEARHAGFLNVATAQPITLNNGDFEIEDSPGFVAKAVAPYIASLNGGPPLTYGLYSTAANDIAILNFALALEYLEAEFYNINVSMFY